MSILKTILLGWLFDSTLSGFLGYANELWWYVQYGTWHNHFFSYSLMFQISFSHSSFNFEQSNVWEEDPYVLPFLSNIFIECWFHMEFPTYILKLAQAPCGHRNSLISSARGVPKRGSTESVWKFSTVLPINPL